MRKPLYMQDNTEKQLLTNMHFANSNGENNMKKNTLVLKSIRQICSTYGVSFGTVKRWIDMGAPIAVLENGCAKALVRDLQDWLLEQSRDNYRQRLKEEI